MRVRLSLIMVALPLRALLAQCPDGSPPPCGRRPAAARAVLDPHAVAVLPFRVTTSDTLLGEGFAELLAAQFTGEGSPRAVDMATVLSSWRQAGGGLRAPLPRARAVSLGRELGAGLISEGSIVGLGNQVTVTTTLVAVPGGEVRGQAASISGPADSLDALLRRTTTALLASIGGQAGGPAARFTDSPAAMRAYLEGLSAWRRGRLDTAAAAFDRAIAEDSSFAQARFRRYLAANWGVNGALPNGRYARLAWDRRDGLSIRERALLETLLGPNYPAPRLLETKVQARQQLAQRYPDSPDSWYFLGDMYFHYGRPVVPVQYLEFARDALEKSAAIDSQAEVLGHVVWTALLLRDTATLRRSWRAFDRTQADERWTLSWQAAATLHDAAGLQMLRRELAEMRSPPTVFSSVAAIGSPAPARDVDEMFDRLAATTGGQQEARAVLEFIRGLSAAVHGRPGAAERAWALSAPTLADEARIERDLEGDAEGMDVAGALDRAARGTDERLRCIAELWHRSHGDSATVDAEHWRSSSPHCARSLDVASLGYSRASDAEARLMVLDSTVHNTLSVATTEAYEAPVLARAWEQRGNPARAAVASRLAVNAVQDLRMEGRLSVLAGDTAAAVHAWRAWLALTTEAEPLLRPVRDSIQAQADRLEHR